MGKTNKRKRSFKRSLKLNKQGIEGLNFQLRPGEKIIPGAIKKTLF